MPIMCFFGPDGSGKTSLAKRTAPILVKRGFRVRVSWMRGTHTLSFMLAKMLCQYGIFKGGNSHRIVIPSKLRAIWRFVEFVSIIPVLIARFIIPNLLGFWVVAERYTPDFIVWVSIITNNETYVEGIVSKFLLSLARKAEVRIYVTADIDQLNQRSHENVEFLTPQLRLYGVLARALDAYTLNTTRRDVEDSFQEVMSLVDL